MFRAHREKFLAKLPPGLGRDPARGADAHDVRTTPTTRTGRTPTSTTLTGLEEPDAIAVFRPGRAGRQAVRPLRPRRTTRGARRSQGPRPGPEGAVVASTAPTPRFRSRSSRTHCCGSTCRPPEAGPGRAGISRLGARRLYLSDGGDSAWAEKFRARLERAARARDAGPSTIVDAREIVHELRLVKDADELALLRRAAEISARGHVRAMAAAAPGRYEFEVQQALDSYCFANGARRMAYPSIVASGPNSVFLHWEKNDRQIRTATWS